MADIIVEKDWYSCPNKVHDLTRRLHSYFARGKDLRETLRALHEKGYYVGQRDKNRIVLIKKAIPK